MIGAPAVNQQLRRWASRLNVSAPVVSAEPEPATREPRGLRWVSLWLGGLGVLLTLLSMVILIADAEAQLERVDLAVGGFTLVVGLVLGAIGLLGVAAAWGIWKRRRWAWMAALVLSAFQVLQVLMALASGGFSGLVSYGILSALIPLVLFYYLTRPHVAAAFGRRSSVRSATRSGQD